jgi:AbrB family looped-hinge helix DNA binding protein
VQVCTLPEEWWMSTVLLGITLKRHAAVSDLSVTSKGQVTIPKAVRQKLGIRAGSKVQFRVVGNHAEMVPVSTPVEVPAGGYGLLKSRRGSAPADFDVASLLRRK